MAAEFNLGTLNSNGTPAFAHHFVGNSDSSDTFSFKLASSGNINLALTGMSADADVRLYRDFNGNGIVDSGDTQVGVSRRGSNSDESINIADQGAGAYVAEVYQYSGDTNYDLRLSTTPSHADPPSNLLAAETEVGSLTSSQSFNDSLSNNDDSEFGDNIGTANIYHFVVNTAGNFSFNLTGLTADADIRLIQDSNGNRVVDPNTISPSGEVLGVSRHGDTLDESITQFLNPGNYFVQVYQYANADINYNLTMTPVA
jgi:hypothetical protein